ncbi:hypothetical protein [Roseofilum casamattae]|uniref:Uncharacterized protein n=1 Tax=Roseofilum casamattae BLCC-M143 TaxID=3022442 RepID=A0ABT7C0N6_9CYAN|nr:hypothetical protein [Roseofilum casamattae]MDJ1185007.1 hypothetical protein [Roseofilum casamattae BLCC-M143]
MTSTAEESFNGIVELAFKSKDDIPIYLDAGLKYLGDDEPNFLRRSLLYTTTTITYYDEIENPAPTWETQYDKFHITIGKQDDVSLYDFHQWMQVTFAPQLAKNAPVIKLRLTLMMEAPPNPNPDLVPDIQAAIEIGFRDRVASRAFLASNEYKSVTSGMAKYVKSFQVYPERSRSTICYDGVASLAGLRGLSSALTIEKLGAINQMEEDITQLIAGKS